MKEGKIVEYNGFLGEIECDNENYIFLNDDLQNENMNINIGDKVIFNGEIINGVKRAFFVKNKNVTENASFNMGSNENERKYR